MQRIKVTLLSGKNLMPSREAAVCDPFCVIKLGTQKYISSTKRGVNPVWNEGFLFAKPERMAILHIDTMNKDRIKVMSAQNIGSSEVDISSMLDNLPQTLNVPTRYGSLQVKIDDPLKAQSFGNTRTQPLATQAIKPSAQSQQLRPTSTRPQQQSQRTEQEEQPSGGYGHMGRGGRGMGMGMGPGGFYPPPPPPGEDEDGMPPPPMFPMQPPHGGWRRPGIMRPGGFRMEGADISELESKYGRWGQNSSDGTDASSSSHGSGRGFGGRGRGGFRGGRGGPFGFFRRPHSFGRWNGHMGDHKHHEDQLQKFDPSFTKLDEDEAYVPPTELPTFFEETEEEKAEKLKRWATFAAFLAKPFEYDSKYKAQLQELDAMGCINLDRVRRQQIPKLTINMCLALFFNTYEGIGQPCELGASVVNNAMRMAKQFKERGYRIFYFHNATPMDFYMWTDYLGHTVQSELVVYFNGHSSYTVNADNNTFSDLLLFYDAKKKFEKMMASGQFPGHSGQHAQVGASSQRGLRGRGGASESGAATSSSSMPPPPPGMPGGRRGPPKRINGIDFETADMSAIYKLVANKECVDLHITFIIDNNNATTQAILKPHSTSGSAPLSCPATYTSTPPNNVVIRSILKGTSTTAGEAFTTCFTQLLASKAGTTFNDLKTALARVSTQTAQFCAIDTKLLSASIIPTVEEAQQEVQIEEIQETIEQISGQKLEDITELPEEDTPSQVEQEIAQVRWQSFCDELAKPAPYTSKYKTYLQKLDAMGAINLERITRAQIPPNIFIAQCIVLFFNPYEDLPHTLDTGPVNDALLMAETYLSRNYHVMYICDATPHEYYRWMDYLLDTVKKDLVVFFSGHGTQIKDTTGKEKDGLSEVMVFYDSSRAKKASKTGATEKITAVSGITNETVSDACMFDLITSKEYPDTRVVTITDCCHSGTMFNFDQRTSKPASSSDQSITPPLNVVCIGSAQDSETAKQTSFNGVEAGVFTYNFTKYIKDKPKATFNDLKTYMTKQIKKYQNINLNASSTGLLSQPIISDYTEE